LLESAHFVLFTNSSAGVVKFAVHRESRELYSPQYSSSHTSHDLLFKLDGEYSRKSLNYEIVAQTAEEVQDLQNAPVVSMGSYLVESGQVKPGDSMTMVFNGAAKAIEGIQVASYLSDPKDAVTLAVQFAKLPSARPVRRRSELSGASRFPPPSTAGLFLPATPAQGFGALNCRSSNQIWNDKSCRQLKSTVER
jgi:hypothetical protein